MSNEYHNDAFKIQIQKRFSVSKAEGKNKNTKDLDFAISSSFFKGQKNNYAFKIHDKIQIQKRFSVSYFLMRRHAAIA